MLFRSSSDAVNFGLFFCECQHIAVTLPAYLGRTGAPRESTHLEEYLRSEPPPCLWGPALRGTAQVCFCKRPVSGGIPAGIPAGISALQCEAGVLNLFFMMRKELLSKEVAAACLVLLSRWPDLCQTDWGAAAFLLHLLDSQYNTCLVSQHNTCLVSQHKTCCESQHNPSLVS